MLQQSWFAWFFGQFKEKKFEAGFLLLIIVLLAWSLTVQVKIHTPQTSGFSVPSHLATERFFIIKDA